MLKELSFFPLFATLVAGSLSAYANENQPNMQIDKDHLITDAYNQKTQPSMMQNAQSSMQMQQGCQDIVPFSSCPNHWRVSGDYLYFLPTIDDTYFVIDAPFETGVLDGSSDDLVLLNAYPAGKRRNNNFGFHSGFRVGAEFAMCRGERELEAYYTYLSADTHRKVSGNFLSATSCPGFITTIVSPRDSVPVFEDYPGSASSKISLLYERLDVDFSQQIVNAHGVHAYLKAGLEGAYLRVKEHRKYDSHYLEGRTLVAYPTSPYVATYEQKSKAAGIGPQIGLAMDYNFYESPSCASLRHVFSMTGLFSGSLLASRQKFRSSSYATVYNNDTDEVDHMIIQNLRDQKTWRMIPALHARVGLQYTMRSHSAGLSLEVGYEFNSYVRGLERTIYPNSEKWQSSNQYYNFDVQGLYATAGLSF